MTLPLRGARRPGASHTRGRSPIGPPGSSGVQATPEATCEAGSGSLVLRRVPRPYGLSDTEYAAIRALQEGIPVPSPLHAVWEFLHSAGLVWVDNNTQPPAIRLTPRGHAYTPD